MQIKFSFASAVLAFMQSLLTGSDMVRIVSLTGSACVAAPQASPGALVVPMFCGPLPTRWVVEQGSGPKQIKLYGPDYCIAQESASPLLKLAACSPQDPLQRFSINDTGTITGQNNLCMTLPSRSQDRQSIFMAPCDGSPLQGWIVSSV